MTFHSLVANSELERLCACEAENRDLRAKLAEAERRAAIDQRQCDEMTSEAGRLAGRHNIPVTVVDE